jgi:hypothetical protein
MKKNDNSFPERSHTPGHWSMQGTRQNIIDWLKISLRYSQMDILYGKKRGT